MLIVKPQDDGNLVLAQVAKHAIQAIRKFMSLNMQISSMETWGAVKNYFLKI